MGGIFELPSGKTEPGETLDAALRRETREETGLDVGELVDFIGSFDYVAGDGQKARQFTFLVTVSSTRDVRLAEHDAYQWASLEGEPPVTAAVSDQLKAYRAKRGVR